MEKRYQVFVSSTYLDLQDERQEIMQALLELDCIPAGMELFPAANEDQWTLIKRVIDDCDYYILVVANRYGAIGQDGISYTEMEYRYALERNKPIIGFLHETPSSIASDKSERSPEAVVKLDAFRVLVRRKAVRGWNSPADLGSKVSRSIIQLIKNNPAVGWVRADAAAKDLSAPEILRLRTIIDDLAQQLKDQTSKAPEGASELAQGNDEFHIELELILRCRALYTISEEIYNVKQTWNMIFNAVGPYLMGELSERALKKALGEYIKIDLVRIPEIKQIMESSDLTEVAVKDRDFQTIKVQLSALGLIEKSRKNRGVRDTGLYWSLTPFGESTLNTVRAIRRTPPPE